MSSGRDRYLRYLLEWTLPLIAALTAMLAVNSRRGLVPVLRATLPPVLVSTAWLATADQLAISAGVWRFDDAKNLGIRLGAVPLEEVLFFLLTNLLIALGLALLSLQPRGGR